MKDCDGRAIVPSGVWVCCLPANHPGFHLSKSPEAHLCWKGDNWMLFLTEEEEAYG